MRTKTSFITYRFKPCNCGCKGSDPWHKTTYRRVVRNVREMTGVMVTRDGYPKEYRAIGYVTLPMSTKPVQVCDCSEGVYPFWIVDYSNLEMDK
jgi:hypothetical protein